jgi:hypothetical protein
VVRNNIIVNVGGNTTDGFGIRAGIYIDGDTSGDSFRDVQVLNNTVHRVQSPTGTGNGIAVHATGTVVRNNIVSEAVEEALFASAGTLAQHGNNLFYRSVSGAILVTVLGGGSFDASSVTAWEPTARAVNPGFVKSTTPYSAGGFDLQSSSQAIDSGVRLSTFVEDFFGNLRGSTWDIGAAEFTTDLSQSVPPSNFRLAF